MIAAGHFQDIDKLEKQISIFQEEMKKTDDDDDNDVFPTDKSPEQSELAIGFIGFSSLSTPRGWKEYEYVLKFVGQYKGGLVEQWEDALKVYRKNNPDYMLSEEQLALKNFAIDILENEK